MKPCLFVMLKANFWEGSCDLVFWFTSSLTMLNVFAILPVLCLFCYLHFAEINSFSLFFVLQRLWMMSLRRWRRRESGRYTWISPSFLLKNIKHCEQFNIMKYWLMTVFVVIYSICLWSQINLHLVCAV